jgi:hypothetical protein
MKPASKPRTRRSRGVNTALPNVSASSRRVGKGATGQRNLSQRAAKKAVAVLEDSATERPTRKSSRAGSKAHLKAATPLARRQTRRVSSPKAKATKARAQKTRVRA